MPKILNNVVKLNSGFYTRLLTHGTPFVFSRWGDGEWEGMLHKHPSASVTASHLSEVEVHGLGQNCDGHFYYPNMCDALRGILLDQHARHDDRVFHGLLKIARRMYEPAISDILPGFQWVDGDVLLEDFIYGRLSPFFAALRQRRVLYVGPERMQGLTAHLPVARWVSCPLKNAWLDVDRLVSDAATFATPGDVIGLSCGPAAKVIAHRLHQLRPDVTLVDFGSMFDGVCGFKTRSYHKGRDWALIAQQMR